ncbi:hypothetical protein ABZ894_03160 [Nocardia beijingensis]
MDEYVSGAAVQLLPHRTVGAVTYFTTINQPSVQGGQQKNGEQQAK